MSERVRSLLANFRFHDALRAIEEGEKVPPEMLAAILTELGRVDDALPLMLEFAARQPVGSRFLSQLLALSLHAEMDPGERARLHRFVGESFGAAKTIRSSPVGGRKIRVGYLSGAFYSNPEIYFLLPVLRHHDRARFEVTAYAAHANEDEKTREVKSLVDRFVSIATLSDEDAVDRIRCDERDILVDCSGHFGGGRPGVVARGLAPVHIGYPLYPSTTGLAVSGYRIADRWTDPPGSATMYIEELANLERGCFVYEPPLSPAIPSLPRERNRYVTFGVFARPAKWTESMLRLYARIMAVTPDSRIVFHHVFNGQRDVDFRFRAPIEQIFAEAGVASEKLTLRGQLPLADHMDLLASTDICLDTFPYHGMTTTCKCLWMGVPVVTLAGECHVSRVGVSILERIGLPDWIAGSPDEFVEIAVRAAQNSGLSELRRGLRERVAASSLVDAAGHVGELEILYQRLLTRPRRGGVSPFGL